MKMNKFKTLVIGLALSVSALIGVTSAQAADGFKLEYNKDASSETTRAIDVYKIGNPDVLGTAKVQIQLKEVGSSTNAAFVSGVTLDKNSDVDDTANTYKITYLKSSKKATLQYVAEPGSEGFDGEYLGSFIVAVGAATDAFDANVLVAESASYDGTSFNGSTEPSGSQSTIVCESITVPAFATAPVEPEKDEVGTARNDFASYADAAVTTFIAGEKAIADVASKTLTWKLTSTEGGVFEKAATVTTDLNGEGSVIFGLMIVNDDAEDFAKIDSAVLVIE